MTDAASWPFSELRVLDLSTGIAGPYATKLLVDGGAEVVKVEPPGGDPLRRWSASGRRPADEDGALFQFLNAGKKSIVRDLDAPSWRSSLPLLSAGFDLVVEDHGPALREARGLDFAALTAGHPALCLVSISAFGLGGPWSERPATEWTLAAEVGATAYRGLPERGPVGAGGRLGEWVAGTYAAVAALAAWRSARRSGVGEHADLSAFEAIDLSMTVYHDLAGQFFEGPLAQAIEIPSILPARDGWVGICTYTGQQWSDLCALMGRPEIAEDERFFDGRTRMEHLEFMQEVIHGWSQAHSVEEIIELATAMRIPVAPIGDGRNVLEMDHLKERGVFVEHPAGFAQPRTPYSVSGAAFPPLRPAPAPGEHEAEFESEAPPPPSRSVASGAPRSAPFEGLRIVDLTAFWAGPVVTSTLGALGADVVKVESIQRPDGMRFAGAVRNEILWEWAHVFHGANTGKRAITLDLNSEDGRALLRRLVESADALVENFSARVMDHFGLSWETLHEWNPRLVMLRMPAWGLEGPWRDRTGFAANVEQASGLAWITGYTDMPLIVRGACDPVGGMHAAFGLLMALEERRRAGKGQLVECPLVEPALNMAAEQVIEWTAYGELLERQENRGPVAAPQGVYRCLGSDAWVAIAVASDDQWAGLRRAFADPDWTREPTLAHEAGRRAAHDALDAALSAWCASRKPEEIVDALLAAGVPAAHVVNGQELMPHPQLEARRFFQTLEHPVTGATRYPGIPMRFSGFDPRERRTPAPTLGQHNEEVLGGELGLSEEELERLRSAKVIGKRPAWME